LLIALTPVSSILVLSQIYLWRTKNNWTLKTFHHCRYSNASQTKLMYAERQGVPVTPQKFVLNRERLLKLKPE